MTMEQDALEYHQYPIPGKLEITPTKPCLTQRDLSLAYTPGVAAPCREIEADPLKAFQYTARGNLIAVVTNGTAVLGLGDIGALAGKPVMEGKSLLFKSFSDIDAIDIELDTHDPEAIINAVKLMEPTFGGINLEDIKAPECFVIEERLKAEMDIPVFHDDQHGTAIISGAALLNALELVDKRIEDVKIVTSGAGASAIASMRFYVQLGARRENIVMCDSKGPITPERDDLSEYKREFSNQTDAKDLAEALADADVFVGLSIGGVVTQEMVKRMAEKPIVFAMANPDPEITYEDAREARPDAIVATGRSDYPNQVNNVLGFPFIFRGALDVRSRAINEEMKIAAAQSLADLAKEDVPDAVVKAYGLESLTFGRDYLIPKPLDPRVLLWEAPAVARAAIETGVARIDLDIDRYVEHLEARLGKSRELMRVVFNKARTQPKRIALAEGEHPKMIRAAHQLVEERIGHPVLLGNADRIRTTAGEIHIDLDGIEVADPRHSADHERYAERLFQLRGRKGVTRTEAHNLINNPNYYGSVMLELGEVDGLISGLSFHYPEVLRPPLQVVGTCPKTRIAAGVYLVTTRDRALLFADTTVNTDLTAETLAEVAVLTAELAQDFNIEPRIAMLSFSDFGSTRHPRSEMVRQATELVRQYAPDLVIEGELMADTALMAASLNETYPFNRLRTEANVLIFPNLEAGNIAYKLMQRLAEAEVVGPILVGMRKPVHILQRGDEVKDIVNLAALAVVQAQKQNNRAKRGEPVTAEPFMRTP